MRAAWLVVLVSACSVHRDDWAREFGTALCRHEQRCKRVAAYVDCTRPGYWAEDTVELAAVRAGLLGYSPSDARRCIDLFDELTCTDDGRVRILATTECRAALPGRVEVDAGCLPLPWTMPDVCAPGLRCAAQSGEQCGACQPLSPEGAVVHRFFDPPCGPGLYPAVEDFDAGVYRCTRRADVGEACGHGVTCLEHLDCGRDAGCMSTPSLATTGELGAPCRVLFPSSPCQWPGVCRADQCVEPDPIPAPANEGEACDDRACQPWLDCVDHLCQPLLFTLCR